MNVTTIPNQLVTNGNMASTIVSAIQPLINAFGYSIQANYTTSGTLGGTLSLEASVDHEQDNNGNVIKAGTFVTVTNSPVTLTGAGSFIWNVESVMYPYVRVRYAPAGGDSGVLNVFCFERGV